MWSSGASAFHIGAWLLWLLAAMLGALGTRNPLYLAIVLAVGVLVNSGLGRAANSGSTALGQAALADNTSRARGVLIRLVIVVTVVVALLKGFSIHVGVTVLFQLPEEWPVVGGPITVEGLVSSALDGLSLLAVLSVFAAFSAGADYYALLRSVPAFLHQVGLVTSIGITFVPQTVTRFTEIREAQALRGHKIRRIGDLLPLIMPLLAGGMERSMNLAEAMEARGFSRSSATSRRLPPIAVQLGIALGLGLMLAGGGLFAFLPQMPWLGWLIVAAGVALAGVTVWAVGLGSKRSRYRRGVWRERDTALAALSIAILAILLVYTFLAPDVLAYTPFLRIHMPTFDPVVVVTLIGLASPVLFLGQASSILHKLRTHRPSSVQ